MTICYKTEPDLFIRIHITLLLFTSFLLLSGIRAYEQLGFRAFGIPGKMAAGIAITLQNIGGEIVKRYVSGDTMYCFVICQGHSTRIHLSRESDWTCHLFLIYTLAHHCCFLFLHYHGNLSSLFPQCSRRAVLYFITNNYRTVFLLIIIGNIIYFL